MTTNSNSNPIAVFDSGVGSYSIVKLIREHLPSEHIIYLADRASFPYGEKTHEELKLNIESRINWLNKTYNPKLIVVASNTPSIEVLEEIRNQTTTPLIGVYPPLERAVEMTKTKHIGILTTKGVAESSEIDTFIKTKNFAPEYKFEKFNASDLVALVEPGIFISDPLTTKNIIQRFMNNIMTTYPNIDVMTLSSTHLPFLRSYFEDICPNIRFLDPAQKVAEQVNEFLQVNNLLNSETGSLEVLATIDSKKAYTIAGLQTIFSNIGLEKEIKEAVI